MLSSMLKRLAGVLRDDCGTCGRSHDEAHACAPPPSFEDSDEDERLDFLTSEDVRGDGVACLQGWPLRESLEEVLAGRAPWLHALDVAAEAQAAIDGAVSALDRILPGGALDDGLETVAASHATLRHASQAVARYRSALAHEQPRAASAAMENAAQALGTLYQMHVTLGREIAARG